MKAGLLVVAVGAWGVWALSRRTGYRITRRYIEFGWLLVGPAAGVALSLVGWGLVELIQALGFEGRKAGVAVLVAAIGAAVLVLKGYTRWSTLFLGSADGVSIRSDKSLAGGWNAVGQVVIGRGGPGTVESGVMPGAGSTMTQMPVTAGQVLTDIPVRVLVPADRFDLDRLKWALNQSGRTDIVLVEWTADGQRRIGVSSRWNEAAGADRGRRGLPTG